MRRRDGRLPRTPATPASSCCFCTPTAADRSPPRDAGEDARELVELNRRGLEAQKLSVVSVGPGARGGFEVVARAEARDEGLVQLYLVRPAATGAQQAIVISLVARSGAIAAHRSALEWVVTRLALEQAESTTPQKAPAPAADGKSAGPGAAAASGSAGERPTEKERR